MIFVQRIHHEFKLHYNKLNSNHKRDFPTAYIDDIINRAVNEYIDIFATGTNAKKFKIGFEVTQQRTEMLNGLVVPYSQIIPTSVDSDNPKYNIYEYEVPDDYRYHVRQRLQTNCGTFSVTPRQHDDIDSLLSGYNTAPNVQWRRFPTLIAKSTKSDKKSFFIHVPNNVLVEEFKLTYIKNPKKIFFGGYDTLEYLNGDLNSYNSTSPIVHSELEEDYLHVLIDIMVDLVARILNDQQTVQFTQDKLIQQY
jgi:hypothetical protein